MTPTLVRCPQVAMYPQQCAPWLLSPDSLALLVQVLNGEHLQGAPPAQQVAVYLLEAISTALEMPGVVSEPSDELMQLYNVLRHLSAAGEYSVRQLASELAAQLSALLNQL